MNNEICVVCRKTFPAYEMWFFPRFEQYVCENDCAEYLNMAKAGDEK